MSAPADPPPPALAPLDPSTPAEQLRRWALGESVHRDGPGGGECCPDFSCCTPALGAPLEVRAAFAAASEDDRMAFLGNFLGAAINRAAETRGERQPGVYIAGTGKGPPT